MQKKVYVDGANVAYDGIGKIYASRIKSAVEGLEKYGFEAHVILPSYMYNGNDSKKNVEDTEIVEKLVQKGKLDLIQNYDDIVLISAAYEMKSFILSNDKFSDHKQKNWCTPEIKEWIEKSRIPYEIIEGNLIIPVDSRCKIKRLLQTEKVAQGNKQKSLKAVSSGVKTEIPHNNPEPKTQKIIEIVRKSPKNTCFAALGSEIKKETGGTIKKQFGNAEKFAQFLAERGFEVIHTDKEYYFMGAVA